MWRKRKMLQSVRKVFIGFCSAMDIKFEILSKPVQTFSLHPKVQTFRSIAVKWSSFPSSFIILPFKGANKSYEDKYFSLVCCRTTKWLAKVPDKTVTHIFNLNTKLCRNMLGWTRGHIICGHKDLNSYLLSNIMTELILC